MNEPIDQLHADCIEAQREIRAQFAVLRNRALRWEPRAFPWLHLDQPPTDPDLATPVATYQKGI